MKPPDISEIIRLASNISLLLPLAVYLTRFRYATTRVHIIGALIVVSGVCDLIGFVLREGQQSTAVLFNIYYTLLFFLLTWFYYEILFLNTRRMVVWIGLAIYLQSLILITIFVQSFLEYQTLMWVITAIIMIVYSIAYFLYSISNMPMPSLFGYTLMWINSGVLIYFCLNLFLFILGNYVLTRLEPQTSLLIWSFHNVNNIIKNVLFAVGIYFYKRKIIVDFE